MSEIPPDLSQKLKLCRGCRDDYYNHGGHAMNGQHCWSLPDAKPVTRFRLHWWTAPTVPGAFTEVETLSCWTAPGKYSHYKELPDFAVDPIRLEPPS